MSYLGYPNYNPYYGASQNDQTQNGYGASRAQVTTSSYPDPAAYSTEARQAQYPSQDYSWSAQNQQSYAGSHTNQGQYTGEPSRDSTNSQSYEYQRAHASHIGSNKRQTEIQAYAADASHAPAQPSTQALNELAYASGLESSSLPATSSSRPSQPSQRNRVHENAPLEQPRAQVGKAQQTHGNPSQRGPYATQSTYQKNDQNRLANQAAAALQGLPKVPRAKAASPVVNHPPPAPAPTRTPTPQQRQQSSYPAPQSSLSHQRKQSSQSGKNQQAPSVSRPSTTGPTRNQSPPARTQQSYSVIPTDARPATVPNVNSIANLVTNQDRQASPAYPSPTEESSSTTFINPREVFNPYHREHERVRREAAVAEAAAKIKAAEAALIAKYAPRPEPAAVDHTQKVNPEVSTDVTKSKSSTPANESASGSAPVDESEQAAELRQLLARMKELRGKDAALFQKVWDEEKGAPATKAQITSPAPSQQAAQPSTQAAAQPSKPAQRPNSAYRPWIPDMPKGFNGYTVVVEDNPEGLPDLGKFPAARRVRYSYANRKEQDSPATTAQQSLPQTTGPVSTPATNIMPQPGPLVFNPNVAPENSTIVEPLPARNQDGSTVWPEAKRRLLAEQAVKFLKSDPRHESLNISEMDFIEILEGNPSYIDLCQLIEARGFRFDRAHFARSLITNVPGLSTAKEGSQHSPAPNSASAQARINNPAGSPATFVPPPPNRAAPFMNGVSIKPETPFQQFRKATPLMHQRNAVLPPSVRSRPSVQEPQIPAPMPGSKEEMSRKRGFEDLIDLTNEVDEDYIVPEKRLRMRSPSPDPIATFAQGSQPPSNTQTSFARFGGVALQGGLPMSGAPLRFDTHVLGSSHSESTPTRPPKIILAKKLNKAQALRRNYYDPKTVARDILISTGRHPTERPLNGHLAGLLGNHVELESDLSTIHWEDIDPGGPPAPKTAWSDVPAGPPRFRSRLSISNKADILARSGPTNQNSRTSQNTSPEMTRDRPNGDLTHGAAARGPSTNNNFVGRFGSGNYRREQHPYHPPPTAEMPRSLAAGKRRDLSPGAARRAEDGLRNLAQQTKSLFKDSFKAPESRPSSLRQSQTVAGDVEAPVSQTPPKRRGRPRQSNLSESSPQAQITHAPRRGPGRPPRSTASPQVQISPPRPAGSVRSSQSSVSAGKPRMGRPPGSKNKVPPGEKKTATMSVEVVVPRLRPESERPEFPVFKCRWFKCGTELHNLATLRKHVAKLHKPAQDIINEIGYGCYWKKCSLLRPDEDGALEPTPIATEEEWLDHIDEEHLNHLGQKLGDGPSTQHIGKQNQPFEAIVSKYFYNPSLLPTDARIVSYTDPQAVASDRNAYLADEKGRITTHLTDLSDEPDAVILTDFYTKDTEANKAAELAFNSFLKTQGHPKQDMRAAAEATFKAMAARKEKVGVGIDRGGCTLVNDERRKTFVQNPKISRVVDYDY
jgi:hypothetical protein